jgi:hypothetical protein
LRVLIVELIGIKPNIQDAQTLLSVRCDVVQKLRKHTPEDALRRPPIPIPTLTLPDAALTFQSEADGLGVCRWNRRVVLGRV